MDKHPILGYLLLSNQEGMIADQHAHLRLDGVEGGDALADIQRLECRIPQRVQRQRLQGTS